MSKQTSRTKSASSDSNIRSRLRNRNLCMFFGSIADALPPLGARRRFAARLAEEPGNVTMLSQGITPPPLQNGLRASRNGVGRFLDIAGRHRQQFERVPGIKPLGGRQACLTPIL